MTEEFRKLLSDGANHIRQREAWLKRLDAEPEKATGYDVRKLIERVRRLEISLNDYYHECECLAGLVIAKKLHDERPGPEVAT